MSKIFTLDGEIISTRELVFDNSSDADFIDWINAAEIGDTFPSLDCELTRVA